MVNNLIFYIDRFYSEKKIILIDLKIKWRVEELTIGVIKYIY